LHLKLSVANSVAEFHQQRILMLSAME